MSDLQSLLDLYTTDTNRLGVLQDGILELQKQREEDQSVLNEVIAAQQSYSADLHQKEQQLIATQNQVDVLVSQHRQIEDKCLELSGCLEELRAAKAVTEETEVRLENCQVELVDLETAIVQKRYQLVALQSDRQDLLNTTATAAAEVATLATSLTESRVQLEELQSRRQRNSARLDVTRSLVQRLESLELAPEARQEQLSALRTDLQRLLTGTPSESEREDLRTFLLLQAAVQKLEHSLEGRVRKLRTTVDTTRVLADSLSAMEEHQRERIASLNSQRVHLQSLEEEQTTYPELSALLERREKARAALEGVGPKLEEGRTESATLDVESEQLHSNLDHLRTDKEKLSRQGTELGGQLTVATATCQEERTKLENLDAELASTTSELGSYASRIETALRAQSAVDQLVAKWETTATFRSLQQLFRSSVLTEEVMVSVPQSVVHLLDRLLSQFSIQSGTAPLAGAEKVPHLKASETVNAPVKKYGISTAVAAGTPKVYLTSETVVETVSYQGRDVGRDLLQVSEYAPVDSDCRKVQALYFSRPIPRKELDRGTSYQKTRSKTFQPPPTS